jgi:hypothetical protein
MNPSLVIYAGEGSNSLASLPLLLIGLVLQIKDLVHLAAIGFPDANDIVQSPVSMGI